MLRLLAGRRGLAIAAAAVGVHEVRDKLSIYPTPEPQVVLVETPSELEKQIGVARRALTGTYLDAHARMQAVISRWIGVEQAVESRVKSLVAPDEPLTPGILYVGVATLTGSLFARNRLFWRLSLPPTLLILSLNHFLPKTSHNISSYLGSIEETYFPTFADKHEVAKQHSAMTWERVKDATQNGRETFSGGVTSLVEKLEEASGLKLRETLGWRDGAATPTEKKRVQNVVETAEEKLSASKALVEEKAQEVKEVVEQHVEETKRLV